MARAAEPPIAWGPLRAAPGDGSFAAGRQAEAPGNGMTAKLWRDWDQEGLDKQLNLRARWPKFQDYFHAWASASQLVRERLPRRLDLAYGPTAGQKLDFFPAAGTGPAPLLVFIHGGYWQALDKSDFSYLAPPFVEDGIAFVSLEDEFGLVNLILYPAVYPRYRQVLRGAPLVIAEGLVQYEAGALHLIVDRIAGVTLDPETVAPVGHGPQDRNRR